MIPFPRGFWFLLLFLPVGIVIWRQYVRGLKELREIAGTWREEPLKNLFQVKWFFSSLTFALFIAFIVLALTGVSWGRAPVKDEREGLDISVVIDISRSMLCRDIEPNRLKRSLDIAGTIIDGLQGYRFSVTVYKGDAFTIVPATEDISFIKDVFSGLSPGTFTSSGSDLEEGITKAIQGFPKGQETNKVIMLFTDGESLTGDMDAAAKAVLSAEAHIFVIGVGTTTGGRIPLSDGTVVKTNGGDIVISRLYENGLKKFADLSGGEYYPVTNLHLSREISGALKKLSGKKEETDFLFESRNRYRLFVALALLSISINIGIRVLRWKNLF